MQKCVRRRCGLFSNYFGHLLQFWMCQWDVNITCIFAGLQNLSAYNAFTLFQLHICQVCGSFQCPYCDYYNAAPPGAMTSPGWMLCSLLLMWLVNAVNMTTSISLCVKWWFQQFLLHVSVFCLLWNKVDKQLVRLSSPLPSSYYPTASAVNVSHQRLNSVWTYDPIQRFFQLGEWSSWSSNILKMKYRSSKLPVGLIA